MGREPDRKPGAGPEAITGQKPGAGPEKTVKQKSDTPAAAQGQDAKQTVYPEPDREEYSDRAAGIYLRMICEDDTGRIVAWRNSPEVRSRFLYRAEFTPEGHMAWMRNMVATGRVVQMIICDSKTDEPIGSVYIRDIDQTNAKGEYGIFIGKTECFGRGIGTAAARLMLRYCFRVIGLHRVYLRVLSDNVRAIRSYEKAGFQREAYLRESVLLEGSYCDIILMGILDREFDDKRNR